MTKILSIDDDPMIREMIFEILDTQGFEVVSAENGKEGIELAQSFLPNLIICDVEMPDMDGWGMLQEVRKSNALQEIPFVFLTGLNSMQNLRQGMDLGADDYLTKPFTFQELVTAVEARLERHQAITGKYQEELKKADEKLDHALHYDTVTGLPNRSLMQEHMLSMLNHSGQDNLAVISLSLDHLDQLTQSRPQAFGNLLQKTAAQRLKKIFIQDQALLYLEHNHFLGFLPTDSERQELQRKLRKIQLALSEPFKLMSQDFYLTLSLGIALYPNDAQEAGHLAQLATDARKAAEQSGSNHFRYYH